MKIVIFSTIISLLTSFSVTADAADSVRKKKYITSFVVGSTHQKNFITAKIDNKAIANSELMDRYRFVVKASQMQVRSESEKTLLLDQILDKMIDEALIRKEAEKLGVTVSPEELEASINEVSAKQNKSVESFKAFFTDNKISFDNYLKQMESEILWSKIVSGMLKPKVKVTEVEIKELFEQRKYNISVKSFLISEVFISKSNKNAKKLADKLVLELREGADFDNIVKQFSDGYNANNHGEIGWVTSGEISDKIYKNILETKKGGYTQAIFLSDGYHIFKLLDSKISTKIPEKDFEVARNIILSRKLQIKAKGHLMDLRKKSFIEEIHIKEAR